MRKRMMKLAITLFLSFVIAIIVGMFVFRDVPGEMMQKALELRNEGKPEDAADLYGQISIIYPDSKYAEEALFEKGFTYYVVAYPRARPEDQGVFVRLAQNAFEKIIKEYQNSPRVKDSRLYLAEILVKLGKHEQALENYEAVASTVKEPEDLQKIYHQMGDSYEFVGEHEKAIACRKNIIQLNVKGRYLENAYLSLAEYYRLAADDSGEASNKLYQDIIELLHNLINGEHDVSELTMQEALLITAHSYLELKRFDDSKAALDKLEKMNVTPTNRALIEDYRERINRHSIMGQRE